LNFEHALRLFKYHLRAAASFAPKVYRHGQKLQHLSAAGWWLGRQSIGFWAERQFTQAAISLRKSKHIPNWLD
jgi:hypothetical protein